MKMLRLGFPQGEKVFSPSFLPLHFACFLYKFANNYFFNYSYGRTIACIIEGVYGGGQVTDPTNAYENEMILLAIYGGGGGGGSCLSSKMDHLLW